MAQRPGSPRLRDRPYLIVCALAGVLLVVLAIVAVAFVVPLGGGGAALPASPVPEGTTKATATIASTTRRTPASAQAIR